MILLLLACVGAPDGMVRIDGDEDLGRYWIDAFERPGPTGDKPLSYVDLAQASQTCAAAGARLCTAAEWRRACLGPEGANRYGYGPRYEAGRCHAAGQLPSGHTSMMDPEALLRPIGAFPDCATPEGVHDLVGSVEEWVRDDWRGIGGMLEGGAWYTHVDYADCTGRYSRQADYRLDPARRVYSAGVRCCWSEGAPTEADLSPEAIAADARARLRDARATASVATYDPAPEAMVQTGVFMDLWEFPNRPGEQPLVGLTQVQAAERCESAGKRLCSAHEWELACGGEDGHAYPYGDRFLPGACAVFADGPMASGAALACATDAGVHDLVGSVWEWTGTRLDAPTVAARQGTVLREIRGGSWFVDPRKGVCTPSDGYPAAPEEAAFPDVGFRCCRGDQQTEAPAPTPGALACPDGMVSLAGGRAGEDFCVDRYEVPGVAGQRPRGGLDLAGASAACASAGKHLCTAAEWDQACAGPRHRRWPYGDEYRNGACMDASEAADGEGGVLALSGAKADCVTPDGVADLSGNLWEWTLAADGTGVLRGGGWNVSAGLGQCRARAEAEPGYRSPETGARCCWNGRDRR